MEHTNNSYAKRTKLFGMMIFLVISILSFLSLVFAATSVTLNTPADGYISPTVNVTFNCTGTSTDYIQNFSFWTNSTGSFELNKSINYINSSVLDLFNDGTTNINQSIWSNYTSGCDFGGPTSSYVYVNQVVGPPAYGQLIFYLASGGGVLTNRYSVLKTDQDYNDGKFYNITVNMSYYSSESTAQFRISINNDTNIQSVGWPGWGCSGFFDYTYRDVIFYKSGSMGVNNSIINIYINPNGTWTTYQNGNLINVTTTNQKNWYLRWDLAGSGNNAPGTLAYFYLYKFNSTVLGKKNTDQFGSRNFETFSQIFNKGDWYNWNCRANDNIGNSAYATSNRSFMVTSIAPVINVTYPTGTISYAFVGQNLSLNWTVYSPAGTLNSCWFNYNGTNRFVPCNQNYSSFILTEQKDLTFYSNDTANNVGSFTAAWNYSTIEHSFTHAESVYETDNQGFILNVTSDIISSAYLYYNGTAYAGTVDNSSSPGDNIVSAYIDIPTVTSTVNKTFYWVLNTASGPYTTTTHTQTVYPITFAVCNSTLNNTYLNFTYKDEMLFFNINASVPNANFNYWLGQGSTKKSYYYTSYTFILFPNEAPSTGFCFYPSNRTININYIYQAGASGYITRTFNSIVNFTLANTTGVNTNKVLYLIQSADAGPVTIQVVDLTSGNVVSNARVTVTRDIQGQTIAVLDGYTDAAGTIATYLSSVVSYTITASKSGCGTNTQTITPVGSYNMQLNCGGNVTAYSSAINGVTYQHSPNTGISTPGNTTYTYSVSSSFTPIVSARFELWDDTGTMVAYNQTDVSSGYSWCTSATCGLTIQYYTGCADNIKGRYYVNLGNATNYTNVLLEKDAFWKYICINQNNSQQAWKKATNDFQTFMAVWSGGQQTNCIIHNTQSSCTAATVCKWVNTTEYSITNQSMVNIGLCVLKDDLNKMEFNRVLIIFFGIVVVLFILGRGIGFELTNPGSFVMYMAIMIIILSMAGMFTFSGLTPWDWFNQYIYAYICVTLAAGYNLSIIRRYSM